MHGLGMHMTHRQHPPPGRWTRITPGPVTVYCGIHGVHEVCVGRIWAPCFTAALGLLFRARRDFFCSFSENSSFGMYLSCIVMTCMSWAVGTGRWRSGCGRDVHVVATATTGRSRAFATFELQRDCAVESQNAWCGRYHFVPLKSSVGGLQAGPANTCCLNGDVDQTGCKVQAHSTGLIQESTLPHLMQWLAAGFRVADIGLILILAYIRCAPFRQIHLVSCARV